MDTIDRIMLLMKERGVNGATLNRECHLGNAVYYQWKARRSSPSAESLVKVATYLETTVEYLTGQTNRKEKPTTINSGELSDIYFSFAKDAQDNKLDPSDLQMILDVLKEKKKREGE